MKNESLRPTLPPGARTNSAGSDEYLSEAPPGPIDPEPSGEAPLHSNLIEDAPMISSIATVWLPVTNMKRATAFYRDALGLDVVDHNGDWTEVTAGDQTIGLNANESPAGDGGAVIAFAVSGSIDEAVQRLKDNGVTFTGAVSKHPWGQIAPFQDPDGNDLQLYAPPA